MLSLEFFDFDLDFYLFQVSTVGQNYEQLLTWVKEADLKLHTDTEPKNDLPGKKVLLEKTKVRGTLEVMFVMFNQVRKKC